MNNVLIEDKPVQNLLDALDADSNKKVLFNAIRLAALKIARETKSNLRAKLGIGATSTKRYGAMDKGIRVKADKDYCEASVHILGDFRLKFFEKGTAERSLRKNGANRGRILPLYFFRDARSLNMDSTIDNAIATSLKRIAR